MIRPAALALILSSAVFLAACEPPGKPKLSSKWEAPEKITDFAVLFRENCLGCHGDGKTVGPAIPLNDPLYLAIIPKETLHGIVTNGIPRTGMPAFSKAKGGLLTDDQIDIIVNGIYKNWAGTPPAGPLPPYAAAPGDAAAGGKTYAAYLAAIGSKVKPRVLADGFLANPYFLDLVSDQYLRTLLIVGRSDLGIPDYRAVIGQPMTDQQIADVVAWLISQRKNEFGQPLPSTTPQP